MLPLKEQGGYERSGWAVQRWVLGPVELKTGWRWLDHSAQSEGTEKGLGRLLWGH